MSNPFVVVGAGLAAAKAVEALREHGYDGHVVVYGDESHPPYERPPLSKDYLQGRSGLDSVFVHPREWYDAHGVDLRLGTAVTGLDLDGHRVRADAEQPYDKLLLATGAAPRRLAMADESGAPVAYLRTVEHSDRLRSAFVPGGRLVIIGGGWIGLEVAASARAAGTEVTVVEALDLPLLRVLGREVAETFAAVHREHGVDLRVNARVVGIEPAGGRAAVRLEGASAPVQADLVVVGVGVAPNTALAEAAGLGTDNGVLVDQHLRTTHPDVFAAGDVASVAHPVLGRRVRVEHWDNAIGQGAVAGANMVGRETPYERLPYFFTDQYDLGMEYVGHVGPEGYDRVVRRGDPAGTVFTAFWLRGSRILAGMHVNDWEAIEPIRELVGRSVDADSLADPTRPLPDVVRAAVA